MARIEAPSLSYYVTNTSSSKSLYDQILSACIADLNRGTSPRRRQFQVPTFWPCSAEDEFKLIFNDDCSKNAYVTKCDRHSEL